MTSPTICLLGGVSTAGGRHSRFTPSGGKSYSVAGPGSGVTMRGKETGAGALSERGLAPTAFLTTPKFPLASSASFSAWPLPSWGWEHEALSAALGSAGPTLAAKTLGDASTDRPGPPTSMYGISSPGASASLPDDS